MPPAPRALLVALGATAVVVTLGVVAVGGDDGTAGPSPRAGGSPTPTATAPSAPPTPLSELETDRLVVRRAPFCPEVPEPAVVGALGADVASSTVYGNGDEIPVAGGPDVAHEEGCRWQSATGGTAAAWVFAPPVTVRTARRLARSTVAVDGCSRTDQPAYGAPSVAVVCRAGATTTASLRGLFGDAWLTCTLDGPGALARLDDWCAAVAVAAAGG